jgi:hypothetical protein
MPQDATPPHLWLKVATEMAFGTPDREFAIFVRTNIN